MFILLSILFSVVNCQWLLLEKDSPELLTTEPNAQCSGRSGSSMWCCGDDLFVFGGFDGTVEHSDLWKYETESRRWLWQPDPPNTVAAATESAYWSISGEMWIYGGISAAHGVLHNMWKYEPETRKWTLVVPNNLGPGPRYGTSFWTHKSTNNLYLYGGFKTGNESHADMWSYNIQSNRWTNVPFAGESPGPRISAAAVLGHSEDTVYFFGGSMVKDGPSIGKMRQLDLTTMTWSFSPIDNGVGPPSRSKHTMWMTPKQDKVAIFGGHSGSNLLKDLWFYDHDLEQWTQDDKSGGPTARYGAAHCIDEHGDMYTFGGSFEDPKFAHNDLWKNGPLSSTNIFQLIGFKLDILTVSATLAATMSTIMTVVMFFVGLCLCVKRCRKHRYSAASVYKANILPPEQQL